MDGSFAYLAGAVGTALVVLGIVAAYDKATTDELTLFERENNTRILDQISRYLEDHADYLEDYPHLIPEPLVQVCNGIVELLSRHLGEIEQNRRTRSYHVHDIPILRALEDYDTIIDLVNSGFDLKKLEYYR